MKLADAERFIESNDVYFGETEHPITEIQVTQEDDERLRAGKDMRDSRGRMRLNVHTRDGKIVKISHVM